MVTQVDWGGGGPDEVLGPAARVDSAQVIFSSRRLRGVADRTEVAGGSSRPSLFAALKFTILYFLQAVRPGGKSRDLDQFMGQERGTC